MRVTVVGATALALSVVSFLYSLAHSIPWLTLVSVVIAALAIHEYYHLRSLDASGIEVRRSVSPSYVRELEAFSVELAIANRSDRTYALVELEDLVPRGVEVVEGGSRFSIALPREYEARVSYRAMAKYPGEHEFSNSRLCIYSPLTMFSKCFDFEVRSYLIAVPLSVRVEDKAKSFSRLVGLLRGLSHHGLYDLEGFRDYAYGDDVRKVVWRVLARERRLVVRVDRGEASARVATILLLRRYTWVVGEGLNTLAHRLLRAFQSIVETLSMPSVSLDAYLLALGAPRVVLGAGSDAERLYRSYTWVSYLEGFQGDFRDLLNLCRVVGVDLGSYDFVIVVTDLYTLARDIDSFVEVLSRVRKGLVVALRAKELGLDDTSIATSCAKRLESVGIELDLVSEGFEVMQS